jgi:hypothetical protein
LGYPVAYRAGAPGRGFPSPGARSPARAPRAPANRPGVPFLGMPEPPPTPARPPVPGMPANTNAPPAPRPQPVPASRTAAIPAGRLAARLFPWLATGLTLWQLLELLRQGEHMVAPGSDPSWANAGWTLEKTCLGGITPTHQRWFTVPYAPSGAICGSGGLDMASQGVQAYGAEIPAAARHFKTYRFNYWFFGTTAFVDVVNFWSRPAASGATVPVGLPGAVIPVRPAPEVDPAIHHPLLNPIGLPRPMPRARPRARPVPRPGPWDMPGRTREGAEPVRRPSPVRGRPIVPEFMWAAAPSSRPSVRQAPAPARRPPRRNEKEKKSDAQKAFASVLGVALSVTEFKDLVDALTDALGTGHKFRYDPNDSRSGFVQKLHHLWDNFEHVDPAEALTNIVKNHIEDKIIGAFNRWSGEGLRKMGSHTTAINTGASGLPDAPFIP